MKSTNLNPEVLLLPNKTRRTLFMKIPLVRKTTNLVNWNKPNNYLSRKQIALKIWLIRRNWTTQNTKSSQVAKMGSRMKRAKMKNPVNHKFLKYTSLSTLKLKKVKQIYVISLRLAFQRVKSGPNQLLNPMNSFCKKVVLISVWINKKTAKALTSSKLSKRVYWAPPLSCYKSQVRKQMLWKVSWARSVVSAINWEKKFAYKHKKLS